MGAARLAALPPVRRTQVAPLLAGRAGLPGRRGGSRCAEAGRIVWAGLGQWLFEGEAPVPADGRGA